MVAEIFKAYDVRGIYGKSITAEIAKQIGKALVSYLKCAKIIVGKDMRVSSPELAAAFTEGANEMGCSVVSIGTVSTDCLYFASGNLNLPGVMFTASHNPKEYNGIKFCDAGAKPLNYDNALKFVKEIIEQESYQKVSTEEVNNTDEDMLAKFGEHVRSFIDAKKIKQLKIAVDAGNGMGGSIVPAVYNEVPVEILPLYFELDGNFPNHPADPSKFDNLKDLQKKVFDENCDYGMAFDGDADRIFFIDDKGDVCNSSLISSLIAKQLLTKHPNQKVIHNVVCSKIVKDTIEKCSGTPIRERVGHSYIKETMGKEGALFGCEHSAHYYYKDNFNADSGIITSVLIA